MKLFVISQTENDDYDTYDSAVVCAVDEHQARHMDPGGNGAPIKEWRENWGTWCSTPAAVTVEYIGEAKPGSVASVICASFNAG